MSSLLLSASQVDTFRTCSLKWHYRHIERAPEEARAGALILGTAVDVAIKAGIHLIRSGESTRTALRPVELLREAWEAEIRADDPRTTLWGEKGQEAAYRAATGLVESFWKLTDIDARLDRLVALDVRFELPVVDPMTGNTVPGLAIQGILDAVEKGPDGRLRALDYKTSASRAGWSPEDLTWHLQGSLYSWALKQIHGDLAGDSMAFCVGLKLKEPVWEDREVTLGAAAHRRALLTVLGAARSMKSGPAYPQPSWLCSTCPYAKRCATWHEDARSLRTLDPFAETYDPELGRRHSR